MNRPHLFASLALAASVAGLSACQRAPETSVSAPSATAVAPQPAPVPVPEMPKTPYPAIESLLRPDDTLTTAQTRLGAKNVVARELDGAEGETFQGWVLYPDDPVRSIEVVLDETGQHPAAIRVSGEKTSVWTRSDGVRIGMTTVELETINGKPFEFSGFGWDYGGAITDWRGGKLDDAGHPRGGVTLCEPEPYPEDYPAGDQAFSSDDPRVRKQPATVCEFGVNLAG